MKVDIAEDLTRTHEFTKTEKGDLRRAMKVVEKAAFFYRDTDEGAALKAVIEQLEILHDNEPLVAEPPVDEKVDFPPDTGSDEGEE